MQDQTAFLNQIYDSITLLDKDQIENERKKIEKKMMILLKCRL